jgi:hypothetical protein
VNFQHVTDPNILCLSRDWNEYDVGDEDDNPVDIDEGVAIFFKALNKTCPEVMRVAIRWDGFDDKGVTPFYLTLDTEVHREEPRSYLLRPWIDHHKAKPKYAEIPSQLFTDEKECYWADHAGKETSPLGNRGSWSHSSRNRGRRRILQSVRDHAQNPHRQRGRIHLAHSRTSPPPLALLRATRQARREPQTQRIRRARQPWTQMQKFPTLRKDSINGLSGPPAR